MVNCSVEPAYLAPFISPVTHISDPKTLIPSASAEIKKIHHAAEGKRDGAIRGAVKSYLFFVVEIDVFFFSNGRNQIFLFAFTR